MSEENKHTQKRKVNLMDFRKTINDVKVVVVERITAKVIQGTVVGEAMEHANKNVSRVLWTGWQEQWNRG